MTVPEQYFLRERQRVDFGGESDKCEQGSFLQPWALYLQKSQKNIFTLISATG